MITIITYFAPHRKTQDVIYKLLLTGRKVYLLYGKI